MNPEPPNIPDDFQKAWQSQASQPSVTIAADLLRSEVVRNQQVIDSAVRLRDVGEVVTAMVTIPLWFFLGAWLPVPWTWYLVVPGAAFVACFMLIDRARHTIAPGSPEEPLVRSIQSSLRKVDHQIELLRSILWWYILPLAIPMTIFFVHVVWRASQSWSEAAGAGSILLAVVVTANWSTYWFNQLAVRRDLEPRRQELLALLANLQEEASVAPVEADAATSSREPANYRRTFLTILVLAAITAVVSVAAHYAGRAMADARISLPFVGRASADYPKLAPYAAIRWEGDQPIVQINGEWFKLVSLDDLSTTAIVAHSHDAYGNLWQKRFEEDLVELLSGMGYKPGSNVRLVVQPLEPADAPQQTLDDVPMTPANRAAIYQDALNRSY